jgi:hypothetical protein
VNAAGISIAVRAWATFIWVRWCWAGMARSGTPVAGAGIWLDSASSRDPASPGKVTKHHAHRWPDLLL